MCFCFFFLCFSKFHFLILANSLTFCLLPFAKSLYTQHVSSRFVSSRLVLLRLVISLTHALCFALSVALNSNVAVALVGTCWNSILVRIQALVRPRADLALVLGAWVHAGLCGCERNDWTSAALVVERKLWR